MEFNLDQARLFYRDTLPATKPDSLITNRDLLILDNGDSYVWQSTGWVKVTNPLKGAVGPAGPEGPQGPQGPAGSGGGTGSIGGIRYVTTWAELQAAWQSLGSVRSIHLAANITMQDTLTIPAAYNQILELDGHGFMLTIPTNVANGFFRSYNSLSEANAGIDCQLRFKNVTFLGSGRTSNAINVQATYGSSFEGCRFYNFATAIKCGWMMGTLVHQCYFWENNISIDFDYARFTGGSNSASQCNHSKVTECKFRHSAGQFAAIRAIAVSGLQILHNIFEGVQAGPQYEVFFDDNASNVVKEVLIYGNHVEQQPSIAAFHVRLKDGYAHVGGIYSQYDCTLISFDASAYGKMIVDTIPYLTSGTKFNNINTAGRWQFINPPATFLITDATRWVSVLPINMSINGYDTNGQKQYLQGVSVK